MPKAAITRCTILAVVGDHAVGRCLRFGRHQSRWVVSLPSTTSAVASQTRRRSTGEGRGGRIDRIGVRQWDRVSGPSGSRLGGRFSPSTKIGVDPAKPTDITRPVCHHPARERSRGRCRHRRCGGGGASSGGQCQKTGGADNAGLPRSPLGGFRGTVDSIDDKTMLVSTTAPTAAAKTTVEYNDLTLFADRHRVNADAVVEGKVHHCRRDQRHRRRPPGADDQHATGGQRAARSLKG